MRQARVVVTAVLAVLLVGVLVALGADEASNDDIVVPPGPLGQSFAP